MNNKTKSVRDSKSYKKMTSYLACAIAEGFCEGEGASEEEQLSAWQWLVDTGTCWHLQGFCGRTAKALIESGTILPPLKDTADYYNNMVKIKRQ